jgi:hypothetical protein
VLPKFVHLVPAGTIAASEPADGPQDSVYRVLDAFQLVFDVRGQLVHVTLAIFAATLDVDRKAIQLVQLQSKVRRSVLWTVSEDGAQLIKFIDRGKHIIAGGAVRELRDRVPCRRLPPL